MYNSHIEKIHSDMRNFERTLQNITGGNVPFPSTNNIDMDAVKMLQSQFLQYKQNVQHELSLIHNIQKNHEKRIDNLEAYSRRNCLIIHGVAESVQENENCCMNICLNIFNNNLKLNLNLHQLDRAHRLGRQKQNGPRAIIVKFCSYQSRRIVFSSKKKLKGTKISITESLTRSRYEVLEGAKDAFGRENVWTIDGKIVIKKDDKKTKITTMDELDQMIGSRQNDGVILTINNSSSPLLPSSSRLEDLSKTPTSQPSHNNQSPDNISQNSNFTEAIHQKRSEIPVSACTRGQTKKKRKSFNKRR